MAKKKPIQVYPSDRVRARVEEEVIKLEKFGVAESAATNGLLEKLIDLEAETKPRKPGI